MRTSIKFIAPDYDALQSAVWEVGSSALRLRRRLGDARRVISTTAHVEEGRRFPDNHFILIGGRRRNEVESGGGRRRKAAEPDVS